MEDIIEDDSKCKAYEPKLGEIMIPPPASHALAGDIHRALVDVGALTIKDLANRWSEHFRDGYLVCEIYDADGWHEWSGLTDIGLLALDLLNEEFKPQAVPPIVPYAGDANESAASQPPAATLLSLTESNTHTTPHVGKQ